ncbi:hypothetical protein ABIE65_001294 [Constrictibacter sp. MBR-5]
MNSDPHPEDHARPFSIAIGKISEIGLHRQRGTRRACGIVGVRHGSTEKRHHVVADILVDVPTFVGDRDAEPIEAIVHDPMHRFRIEPLRHRRKAADIGEKDRHVTAFVGRHIDRRRRSHSAQPLAAVRAELEADRKGSAAGRTGDLIFGHERSGRGRRVEVPICAQRRLAEAWPAIRDGRST